MKIKYIFLTLLLALFPLLAHAEMWFLKSGNLTPVVPTWGITVPTLTVSSATATTTINGNAYVKGNLQVDGAFFAPVSLISTGNSTINGNLVVTGTNDLRGKLFDSAGAFTIDQTGQGNTKMVLLGGNVGIGTTNPGAQLDIEQNTQSVVPNQITLISTNATHGTDMLIGQDTVNKNMYFGYYGSGEGSFNNLNPNTAYIAAGLNVSALTLETQNTPITFNTDNWVERMRIQPITGNVGIGTTLPVTKLDVNGLIRVYQTATTTCTTVLEGSIFYNGTAGNKSFYGCDGTNWVKLN